MVKERAGFHDHGHLILLDGQFCVQFCVDVLWLVRCLQGSLVIELGLIKVLKELVCVPASSFEPGLF